MGSSAQQTSEAVDVDGPGLLHPSASMNQASKAARHQIQCCIRRVVQTHPNVDRQQLSSFLKKTTSTDVHILVDLALNAIRDGSIGLDNSSLDGGNKRKHITDTEALPSEDLGESSSKRAKVDYASRVRPQERGPHYVELAVNQLHEDFSYVEEKFIRDVFTAFKSLYAPTHLFLLAKQKEVLKRSHLTAVPPLPSKIKPDKDKGKQRALHDADFDRERKWLIEELAKRENESIGTQIDEKADQVMAENDEGRMIECGCCFIEYPSDKISSCPERHMFCHTCISTHTSNLLLVQNSNIKCMSTDGCESFFSAAALRRSLPEQRLNLWERLEQRREIAAAGLVLQDCPFCEFACEIIDDQMTFVCQNTETCGKESCRGCKKRNHLPKTCQEVREDEAREGRHSIAEAMTRALMRNCPKCENPFIKDDGCNKITCPLCKTVSCYLCRQIITGYDHFNSNHPGARGVSVERRRDGKCLLFDAVTERHNDDVIQAATRAFEQVRNELPHVDENELRVELPPPPRIKRLPQRIRPTLRRQFPPPVVQFPYNGVLAAPQQAMQPQIAPPPRPLPFIPPVMRPNMPLDFGVIPEQEPFPAWTPPPFRQQSLQAPGQPEPAAPLYSPLQPPQTGFPPLPNPNLVPFPARDQRVIHQQKNEPVQFNPPPRLVPVYPPQAPQHHHPIYPWLTAQQYGSNYRNNHIIPHQNVTPATLPYYFVPLEAHQQAPEPFNPPHQFRALQEFGNPPPPPPPPHHHHHHHQYHHTSPVVQPPNQTATGHPTVPFQVQRPPYTDQVNQGTTVHQPSHPQHPFHYHYEAMRGTSPISETFAPPNDFEHAPHELTMQ